MQTQIPPEAKSFDGILDDAPRLPSLWTRAYAKIEWCKNFVIIKVFKIYNLSQMSVDRKRKYDTAMEYGREQTDECNDADPDQIVKQDACNGVQDQITFEPIQHGICHNTKCQDYLTFARMLLDKWLQHGSFTVMGVTKDDPDMNLYSLLNAAPDETSFMKLVQRMIKITQKEYQIEESEDSSDDDYDEYYYSKMMDFWRVMHELSSQDALPQQPRFQLLKNDIVYYVMQSMMDNQFVDSKTKVDRDGHRMNYDQKYLLYRRLGMHDEANAHIVEKYGDRAKKSEALQAFEDPLYKFLHLALVPAENSARWYEAYSSTGSELVIDWVEESVEEGVPPSNAW